MENESWLFFAALNAKKWPPICCYSKCSGSKKFIKVQRCSPRLGCQFDTLQIGLPPFNFWSRRLTFCNHTDSDELYTAASGLQIFRQRPGDTLGTVSQPTRPPPPQNQGLEWMKASLNYGHKRALTTLKRKILKSRKILYRNPVKRNFAAATFFGLPSLWAIVNLYAQCAKSVTGQKATGATVCPKTNWLGNNEWQYLLDYTLYLCTFPSMYLTWLIW